MPTGENFFIRFPDAIKITSDTDLVDRDQIIDHIPKKAARLKAARLKASGDESFRLMKLAVEEIETWQKD